MHCPLFHTFTYLWPHSLGVAAVGIRVRVPFGRGSRSGVIVSLQPECSDTMIYKSVLDRLDDHPLYDHPRMTWTIRAQHYYLTTPGEIFALVYGWASHEETRRWHCPDREQLALHDHTLAEAFASRRTLSVKTLARKLGAEGLYRSIHLAAIAGKIQEMMPDMVTEPHHYSNKEDIPEHLTSPQQYALTQLETSQGFTTHLLFGCTGSGKTEVYLRAAEKHIAAGGQVLVLAPEIGLTPQWLARLYTRFKHIAVWHSSLTQTQRLSVRHQLPHLDVLVGTRSALFLPLPKLSLIVVDEEHDTSFKQQEGVAYHARDMAILLAQELNIPVILGSATPSLESWRQVKRGRYTLLELPQRIVTHAPIKTDIVDICNVNAPLSDTLLNALRDTAASGMQSLLYLNRRGYSPALICSACGTVPECPACSLKLTLHRKRKQLRCHACGFIRPVPRICEHCGEDALMPLGTGTERIEEQLIAALPSLRLGRLDRDAVRSEKQLITRLSAFAEGELDCLIGTQMLVKGHHFPKVTLVGVVNADLGLSMPDFRAGERWWQQLTQVSGRTGRGEKPGRVIIQTRNPKAAWLQRIGDAHARQTLDEELDLRRALSCPPYACWVRMVFSATRAAPAKHAAETAAQACAYLPEHIQMIGPMPCAIERMANRYRFELILRDTDGTHLPWHLEPLLARLPVARGVRRKVDVDPLDMM